MTINEEIKVTCGGKEFSVKRGDITFMAPSNFAAQDLHSGEILNIKLDYDKAPAVCFTVLANIGLLSKYDPCTLDLMRKGCKSAHTSNNWLRMHHMPMMRRLTNERNKCAYMRKS